MPPLCSYQLDMKCKIIQDGGGQDRGCHGHDAKQSLLHSLMLAYLERFPAAHACSSGRAGPGLLAEYQWYWSQDERFSSKQQQQRLEDLTAPRAAPPLVADAVFQWRTGERASEMESYGVCVSARETDRRDRRPCISLALAQTP